MEKNIIEKVLLDSNWNRKVAARMLKIGYRALLFKMKDMDIQQRRR